MIEVNITPQMRNEAEKKSGELGVLKNSIESGNGNIIGFLGELIAQRILGGSLDNTYEYDLLLDDGTKIDVKTKKTSVAPKDYYECSIASYNEKQDCDEYCFVRVKNTLDKGWYLGRISKPVFFEKARRLKKGDIDGDNGFVVKADCWNMMINELTDYSVS